jgi:uncharacterized protein (TIGR02271 family)
MDLSSVRAGWDVYGSDGEKIGDVGDVGSNYLMVTKGFLFTKDIYIPTSAIKSIDQDRVYLNVAKDQIDTMGWDRVPNGDTGYGTTDTRTTDTASYTDEDSTSVTSGITTNRNDYVEQPVQQVETRPVQTSTTTISDDDSIRVERYEEELRATKTSREAGEVRISKEVVEEQQTLEVPVTREQVTIRSVDVSGTDADTSQAFQEGTISMTLHEEDVEASKTVRVVEEIEIDKRAVQETERVTDTVRKERINVEEVGDVDVHGGTDTTRRT